MLKSNRPKKEIIIYHELPVSVILLFLLLLPIVTKHTWQFRLSYGNIWDDFVVIFIVILLAFSMLCFVLILKDRYLKKPFLRLTYEGFYYGDEPMLFKWEDVRSIKVAKCPSEEDYFPSLPYTENYDIRIYLATGKCIEIGESCFPGKRHGIMKIFRKYHKLAGEEESY
jgi:hypothetical protein